MVVIGIDHIEIRYFFFIQLHQVVDGMIDVFLDFVDLIRIIVPVGCVGRLNITDKECDTIFVGDKVIFFEISQDFRVFDNFP